MNIHHHPHDELLFDYATGSLHEAWSLAIAAHLTFCPVCRRHVEGMEAIGGALLEQEAPPDPAPGRTDFSFDAVMQAIDTAPALESAGQASVKPGHAPVLPAALRRYAGGDVDDLPWRRLGPGAQQVLIPVSEPGVTARLLRIAPGVRVPEHTHRGLELTVVLKGAFEDHTGWFGPGDLEVADETVEHQPVATRDAECICLAVTDAPLRFRSLAARLVQPLFGI
ncbi:MAG: ChrR family anti-sigma-E factor [Alphaproteobacteria bacterium]